jgi:signal transduction histidine kinase|tara:strand:- start:3534 stop:4379 length:846 start_codon:yes stop_codon:yes gene_type:complete
MDERLKAARFFALHAISGDRRKIRAALRKETIPWIKKALQRSLSKVGPPEPATSTDGEPTLRQLAELRASAIDEVSGTIIHELATIIGRLRLTIPNEIQGYEASRTKPLVDSLATLLSGIRNLKTSAGQAKYVECNLAEEAAQTCADFDGMADVFHFAGPPTFLAEIDPGLFKLALANVIRNAVEAVSSQTQGEKSITINWGWAGHEYWIAVLDSGPGFERDPASLVKLGESTKDEHIGFGLATAKQAMQAMEGDVYPSNAPEGGARVELRWFGSHENSIR